MDKPEIDYVPTASEDMLQPSKISERNELTNGALAKFKNKNSRIRSKSESQHQQVERSHSDIVGLVVKSNKDKNHDRKPRNLKGNGKPKKAGGGGKGTWGKNGEVYEEENDFDPNDPNYDPDAAKGKDIVMAEIIPDITSSQFDHVVTPIFQEYLHHAITDEVGVSLQELNISHLKHRIVYLAVTMAMEQKDPERELISILISDLYGLKVITEQDIELGFQALMNVLPELKLDTPDAPHVLGLFMARCIADDCLNPCYIKEHLCHPTDLSREALQVAHNLLETRHGIVRLDNIWGYGGGIRPVKLLIKKIVLLLKEYLSSGDIKEAERCVIDLDVPHFHHEIVYEAVMIAMEDGSERTSMKITDLLKYFSESSIITVDQMKTGFERVYNNMDDIVLDIPRAHKHLDSLLNMCCRADVISLGLRQKAPFRGRKRFVSEGDFGMSSKPIFP